MGDEVKSCHLQGVETGTGVRGDGVSGSEVVDEEIRGNHNEIPTHGSTRATAAATIVRTPSEADEVVRRFIGAVSLGTPLVHVLPRILASLRQRLDDGRRHVDAIFASRDALFALLDAVMLDTSSTSVEVGRVVGELLACITENRSVALALGHSVVAHLASIVNYPPTVIGFSKEIVSRALAQLARRRLQLHHAEDGHPPNYFRDPMTEDADVEECLTLQLQILQTCTTAGLGQEAHRPPGQNISRDWLSSVLRVRDVVNRVAGLCRTRIEQLENPLSVRRSSRQPHETNRTSGIHVQQATRELWKLLRQNDTSTGGDTQTLFPRVYSDRAETMAKAKRRLQELTQEAKELHKESQSHTDVECTLAEQTVALLHERQRDLRNQLTRIETELRKAHAEVDSLRARRRLEEESLQARREANQIRIREVNRDVVEIRCADNATNTFARLVEDVERYIQSPFRHGLVLRQRAIRAAEERGRGSRIQKPEHNTDFAAIRGCRTTADAVAAYEIAVASYAEREATCVEVLVQRLLLGWKQNRAAVAEANDCTELGLFCLAERHQGTASTTASVMKRDLHAVRELLGAALCASRDCDCVRKKRVGGENETATNRLKAAMRRIGQAALLLKKHVNPIISHIFPGEQSGEEHNAFRSVLESSARMSRSAADGGEGSNERTRGSLRIAREEQKTAINNQQMKPVIASPDKGESGGEAEEKSEEIWQR